MGSKPVRSNVTILTTSFLIVFCFVLFFCFFLQMTSCAMHDDVIYHPFPINSQYLKWWGVDSPVIGNLLSTLRTHNKDVSALQIPLAGVLLHL